MPCFHPLVWTYNDENAGNPPNIQEIVDECARTGCDPTCVRGGGESRVGYLFVDRRIFVKLNININIDDAENVKKIHRDKPQQGEDHSVGDSLLRPGRQVGRGHRQ